MSTDVARLFDAMADSYDRLEPWYEHLYAVLHAILRVELSPPGNRKSRRALDAGCGTGFQTAVLADLGYRCHGLDLSARLLAVAHGRLPGAALARGSIEAMPYRDGQFDVVTCCGSTLSFVRAPSQAVRELGRVLRPGGLLLIECEHKWNLDLAWAWLSSVTRDALGYGVTPADVSRQLARPLRNEFELDYPGYGRLRLFTVPAVHAMLHQAGLTPVKKWGLHTVTNLIPSTMLHRQRLSRPLAVLFRWLRPADAALSRRRLAPWLANSLVVLARRESRTG